MKQNVDVREYIAIYSDGLAIGMRNPGCLLFPIGFSLALYLKEKCGVELIAGADAMYPNTLYNRLMIQERIKILTTNIPKLIKPLFLSYQGVDPGTRSSGSGTDLSRQDEMNWMEGFEPTHIFHLASYSLDVINNDALIDPAWKNTRSPYVLEETTGDATEAHQSGNSTTGSGTIRSILPVDVILFCILSPWDTMLRTWVYTQNIWMI
jgi:hypothetical protein